MAKRKIIRKSNRPFTYNPHYYAWGGDFKAAMGGTGAFDLKSTFSGGNVAGMLKGGLASGIGSAVGNIAGGAISGGLESGAGSAISNIGGTIGSTVSAVNPVLGGIISAGSGIIGGLTNRMFGSKLNEEKIAEVEGSNKAINTVMVDSSSADSVMDQWANQDFGAGFSKSDIGKDGWFSNKAKNKYKELKKQQDIARNRALTSYENAADAADTQSDLNAMASFAAFGGPLGIWGGYGSGAIGYELAKENLGIKALNAANKGKLTSLPNSFESSELNTFAKGGKIHIKPENRGKFTALKKRTGKSATWFKEHGTPAQRKMATFALNARKWKHAFGGDLNTNGGDFSNGLIIIGNGGTHEENPMEGVPMGVDKQGVPNLVEEGEVIFNDYVFSNRMNVPNSMRSSLGLSKGKNLTFAKAAKKLSKEAEERPNDPISRRGLLDSMSKLQQVQESLRQQDQEENSGIQYAHGGRMGTLFNGYGPDANFLNLSRRAHLFGDSVPDQTSTIVPSIYDNNGILTPEGLTYSRASHLGVPIEDIQTAESINKGTSDEPNDKKFDLTALRYAPVVGAAIGLGQNLFSRPDYTSADAILEAANQAGNYTPVEYTPIGNYLQYRPFDRNFYLNKLNAQASATRRVIMNTTSPSRNAALLAADYNAQGRLGDLARQAEEYNLAQRQAVETFNRGTNMANAEMGLKAAMANQEAALKARSSRLSGVAQAMAIRDAVDARRGASMSANLTNFFNSLGDIGREEVMKAWINENPALYYAISTGGAGTQYKGKKKEDKKEDKKAKSGYLTIKKGGENG